MRGKLYLPIGLALLVVGVGIGIVWSVRADPSSVPETVGNVVALAGVILLYLSLRSDSEEQRRSRSTQLLTASLAELRDDLDRMTLSVDLRDTPDEPGQQKTLLGREAVETFAQALERAESHDHLLRSPFFRDLYFIVGTFDTLRTRIAKSRIGQLEERHLSSRLSFLYSSRVLVALELIQQMSRDGRLRIKVESVEMSPAEMLRMLLDAHQKMLQFTSERRL